MENREESRIPGHRIIRGCRYEYGTRVVIGGETLRNASELRGRTPGPFEWGYGGTGPSQLALSILYAVTGDEEAAVVFRLKFLRDCISKLRADEWEMPEASVLEWLAARPEYEGFIRRN